MADEELTAGVDDVVARPRKSPWDIALDFTLRYEGGYAKNPLDRGGETFRGISRNHWPTWPGWLAVDRIMEQVPREHLNRILMADTDLTLLAIQFYRENFWDKISGDRLPGKYAIACFDFAVHSGNVTAVRIRQYVVGAHVDGWAGPQTVEACRAAGEPGLVDYFAARAKLLHDIMTRDESQRVWCRNWFRRLFKLADVVLDGPGVDFV
jgi:lysozyme family protein